MTGNTWIIIGAIASTLAAVALPYGFLKKSIERSAKDKKKIINQITVTDGGFVQIVNFLDTGSTGVFVNLVLEVATFVAEIESFGKEPSIDGYLEWVQKQREQGFVNGNHNLLDVLGRGDEQAALVRGYIETVILRVNEQRDRLNEIVKHTKLLPNMDSKLDYLVNQLSKKDLPSLRKDQLAISAKVLDIFTKGIVGSGIKVIVEKELINAHEGTVMVVWLLGTQSPHMMLLDLVGNVNTNRLSVVLNEDASIGLRAYDGAGNKREVESNIYPAECRLVIIATWKDRDLSLWINGELQGREAMSKSFDYLGPVCLFGIDIEGELSADAVRWTPQGQEVGLNFIKDGIWHKSRFDSVMIWERVLDEPDIKTLAEDPWVMFRWGSEAKGNE